MSYFSKTITVPKNTSRQSYITEKFDVQFGVIHRVYVRIPSGHVGLTGIRIIRGLHQIAPTTGAEWFTGDDMTVDYAEHIEIGEVPFNLIVEAFNEDDTYNHKFIVGVGVLPAYVLLPQVALGEIFSSVAQMLEGFAKWFGMPKGG